MYSCGGFNYRQINKTVNGDFAAGYIHFVFVEKLIINYMQCLVKIVLRFSTAVLQVTRNRYNH